MIFQREMANSFNPDFSSRTPHALEVTSLLNRKLKLPPISSNTDLLKTRRSSPQQRQNFSALPVTVSLPQLDLCSLGVCNRQLGNSSENNPRTSKEVDNPAFSLPRVYSVLPPIGKKLVPSAPAVHPKTSVQNNSKGVVSEAENALSRRRRSTRKPMIKKQAAERRETVTEPPVVDNTNSLIDSSDSSKHQNESFAIHITDTFPMVDGENYSSSLNEKRFETKNLSDEELPELGKIPKELRPYSDVYPVSPPLNERRARMLVLKKRQELRADNDIRLSFIEKNGKRRRNATCSELDEVLKNAVELLRDVFLRKTMEELCMLW